jgi:hypothetical protein
MNPNIECTSTCGYQTATTLLGTKFYGIFNRFPIKSTITVNITATWSKGYWLKARERTAKRRASTRRIVVIMTGIRITHRYGMCQQD